jgi:hypothetical protein
MPHDFGQVAQLMGRQLSRWPTGRYLTILVPGTRMVKYERRALAAPT